MAAKFRKVDPRIWTDERFRLLSPADRLLAVYCLTCPQCNRIGFFHLSLGHASECLGYPCHTLAKSLVRVCDTLRWRFDEASGVLFFPTWWKYNGRCGPKTMAGNLDDLHDVPQTHLINEFASNTRYLSESESEVIGRVCHTHAIPFDVSRAGAGERERAGERAGERDSGETDETTTTTKKRFVPPTIEEVSEYCRERGNRIDPEKFVAYYQSKNWKVGRDKMTDWKAAVITWEKNDRDRNGKASPSDDAWRETLKNFIGGEQ